MEKSSPEWVRFAPALPEVELIQAPEFTPTLVVSIGATANETLKHLVQYLRISYGSSQLPNLELLQIDVVPERNQTMISTRETHQLDQNRIQLLPNVSLFEKNVYRPSSRHIRWWWYENAMVQSIRAVGRLAIIEDLIQGIDNSILWSTLKRCLPSPHSNLWVIASAADTVGACMAFDIALLAHEASEKKVSKTSLLLLLQDVNTGTEVDKSDRDARVYATLEEVDRLGQNQRTHFYYSLAPNQANLRFSIQQSIFDEIFVSNTHPTLHVNSGLPSPILETLAHFLLAMSMKIPNHNIRDWLQKKARTNPKNTEVYALGAFSVQLPINELIQVIKNRIVFELINNYRKRLMGDSNVVITRQGVLSWLAGKGFAAPRSQLLSEITNAIQDSSHRIIPIEVSNTVSMFNYCLIQRIAAILNGEDSEYAASTGRLELAIQFVEVLSDLFAIAESRLVGTNKNTVQDCIRKLDDLIADLKKWRTAFRRSGLLRISENRMSDARKGYREKCTNDRANNSILSEFDEERIYDKYFSHPSSKESILRKAMKSVGWYWKDDDKRGDNKLCFAITKSPHLPGTCLDMDKDNSLETILDNLEEFVGNYTNMISCRLTLHEAMISEDKKTDNVVEKLERYSQLSVSFDPFHVVESNSEISEGLFLVTGDREAGEILEKHIEGSRIVPAPNYSNALLLRINTGIPVTSLKAYSDLEYSYIPTDPSLHVFEPECIVSIVRQKLSVAKVKASLNFPPNFRSILHDGELVEIFVRAAVVGVISDTGADKIELYWNDHTKHELSISGSWEDALRKFTLEWPGKETSPVGMMNRGKFIKHVDMKCRLIDWGEACDAFTTQTIQQLKESDNLSNKRMGWVFDALVDMLTN